MVKGGTDLYNATPTSLNLLPLMLYELNITGNGCKMIVKKQNSHPWHYC